MRYLKLLAKIKDDLETVRSNGFTPETVILHSDADTEKNQGLIAKLLGIPVKIDVDIDVGDGFKIEVKIANHTTLVDFKW